MCFRVSCFPLNNQTIIDMCPLARSQEEEHPNRGEKPDWQEGWLGKKSQIRCLQSPWMKGFEVNCGGGEGGRGGSGRNDRGYKTGILQASVQLASHCFVFVFFSLKSLK